MYTYLLIRCDIAVIYLALTFNRVMVICWSSFLHRNVYINFLVPVGNFQAVNKYVLIEVNVWCELLKIEF